MSLSKKNFLNDLNFLKSYCPLYALKKDFSMNIDYLMIVIVIDYSPEAYPCRRPTQAGCSHSF